MTAPVWSEVTALLGGTFDPPHLGHREAATGLLKNLAVKRVLVIPSAIPPQKSERTSSEHRLEMARLTFPKEIEILDQEIRRAQATGSPSYTFETLLELKQIYGNQLAFVIGTDQLFGLPTWHRFPQILGLCHWLVLDRKGDTSRLAQGIQALESSGLIRKAAGNRYLISQSPDRSLQIIATDALEISSTWIREQLAVKGKAPNGSLTPEAEAYIQRFKLYGT